MPTENPKIFISYSWADCDVVWPLAESLHAKGLEVWIDKREIRPGDRITEQVQKALVECGALLLMWSQMPTFLIRSPTGSTQYKVRSTCEFVTVLNF